MRIINQIKTNGFLFFILLVTQAEVSHAQFSRYIVWLKNKGNNSYTLSNPTPYLSTRALDRRTRYTITIDSTDLPVSPSYLTQL